MRLVSLMLLTSTLFLNGCSWFELSGKEEPPAELVDIESTVKVNRLWTRKIGKGLGLKRVSLRPVIQGSTLYVSDYEGKVQAIDAINGKIKWAVDLDTEVSAGPAANDDLVAIGTLDGRLLVLNAADGSAKWESQTTSEILSVPGVDDDQVVVRSLDGRVFAFSAESGERSWIFDRSVPLLTLRGNSSPIVRAGTVIYGYDSGKVAALRMEDGVLLWEQTVAAPSGRTELERMVDIDGSMVAVAADLYVGAYQSRVASLSLSNGRVQWVKDFSSFRDLGVARTQLYITDESDSVWALERLNGASLWQQDKLARRQVSGPLGFDGYVVVGDFEGYLHFLSKDTGQFLARVRVSGDAINVTPISYRDKLYVLTDDGTLSAYSVSDS